MHLQTIDSRYNAETKNEVSTCYAPHRMSPLEGAPPPSHLVLRRTVPLTIPPEQAREAASDYLVRGGYARPKDDTNRFERGSRALTPVAFSPRLWHAQVTVQFSPAPDPREVRVTFNVETTGQILSTGERDYWEREADALAESIRTGVPQPAPFSGSVLAGNCAATVMMFLVTGLGVAGGLAVAERMGGGRYIWIMGLLCGAIGLLLSQWIGVKVFRHYDRRDKNKTGKETT